MSKEQGKPELFVISQESLAKQVQAKNGIPRDVHMVVKNTPFNIALAFGNYPRTPQEKIDFGRCSIGVDVYYDSENPNEGKRVNLLTSKPCEYRIHLSDKKIDEAILEVRLKVLTSQHEDMLFRLQVTVTDDVRKQTFITTSSAIKVVSKPDQVRRMNGEKPKKRPQSDAVSDTLERIEERQKQQQALLQNIFRTAEIFQQHQPPPPQQQQQQILVELPQIEHKNEEMSFEHSFTYCLKKFSEIPQDERPSKIRKMVSGSTNRDARNISEFVDLITTESYIKTSDVKTEPETVHLSQSSEYNSLSLSSSENSITHEFYQEMMNYALDPSFF